MAVNPVIFGRLYVLIMSSDVVNKKKTGLEFPVLFLGNLL